MANNKVNFLRGTSAEYESKTKDNDTFYYTTDDEKLYLGNKEITSSGITIDNALSDTSENPVQNKVINAALNSKADQTAVDSALAQKANSADVTASLAGKSDTGHTHDSRYYTESEIDTKLSEKMDNSIKGVAGGVASLGDDGKVPSEQLPVSGGVGQNTTGTKYTIDGKAYTAGDGAEIFNDYANNKAIGGYSHAEGVNTTASGANSHAEGNSTIASGVNSHAEGLSTTASSQASHAGGKFSKAMTDSINFTDNTGDAFVIGNGIGRLHLSNAFRVTYEGAVYGLSAFNSSGADYAEFIKPWYDGNPDNEDRVGYMVTIKNGLLHKANDGDYIVGITSGNPSIVGNADEDYYWRYERDEFNRFVYEDAEEEVEQLDDDGTPVLDENGMPVMVKTGNIIKNAHFKLAADYDPTKQNSYVERKNRPEWSYVGMIGVIPVRDDGTCEAGGFAKCGANGVATKADKRDFDTFFVIERINENVISVEMR